MEVTIPYEITSIVGHVRMLVGGIVTRLRDLYNEMGVVDRMLDMIEGQHKSSRRQSPNF
jgi:hypothetical protein